MKRIVVLIITALLVSSAIILFLHFSKNNGDKKEITDTVPIENSGISFSDDLVFEYYENITLDSIIIVNDDINYVNSIIDTTELGKHTLTITFNEDEKTSIEYEVVDTTSPLVINSSTYTIVKGNEFNYQNIFCADNYDKRPTCVIENEYDINTIGEYKLKFVATDSSGNVTNKDITLKVVNEKNPTTPYTPTPLALEDVIKEHKNENTQIGIDVSKWQGDINWQQVKDSGVEFAILRIGFGHNKEMENVLDETFKANLSGAKAAGVPVGVYFYSYADSVKEAIEHANWVVDTLDGESLELPISYDWEEWSKFNSYNLSLTDINNMANEFIKVVENAGYKGMNYGSKSYLNNIWTMYDHTTWLAHYTSKTDYDKDYYIWQLSNAGIVPGIDGAVDLNVLYMN